MSHLLDEILALADGEPSITATLSGESVAVLLFATGFLEERLNWLDLKHDPMDEVTDSQWDIIEKLVANLYEEVVTPVSPQEYPSSFYLAGDQAYDWSGGGFLLTISTTNPHNLIMGVTPLATGNRLHYSIFCKAGTYAYRMRGQKAPTLGITKIYIDDVDSGASADWYNASAINNQSVTGSVVIPTSGRHKLSLVCNTKHASATNYGMAVSDINAYITGGIFP
jgi:hypothetical protein